MESIDDLYEIQRVRQQSLEYALKSVHPDITDTQSILDRASRFETYIRTGKLDSEAQSE